MNNHETIDNGQPQIWDMSDVPFAGEEPDFETARSAEELRERVVDMTTAHEGVLAPDFKSGTYFFHSATVEGIEDIFKSGEILNAGEIYERKVAAMRAEMAAEGKNEEEIEKELKGMMIRRNSGQEGISWSVNGIDAMPGTRGRIAGFVAAPELVLGEDKLVIPSRPAPYELLQVSSDVNAQKLFEIKKQYELWGYKEASLSERATVESGLVRYKMNLDNGNEPDALGFYSSRVKDFSESGGLPADELRKHFEIIEDGHIKIDEDLYQQKFDEEYVPPAAVFAQAMIDQGKFNGSALEGKSVAEIFKAWKEYPKLFLFMLGQARQEGERYANVYRSELDKAKKVGARVEDMYFVTSHKDLDGWLKIMEKTGHLPRGILLYDDEKVVKENFASDERGDCDELSEEIGRMVDVDREFWSERIGLDVENVARAGTNGQVLKDSELNHDMEVRLLNGELKITRV
jgi:hypothetical protein